MARQRANKAITRRRFLGQVAGTACAAAFPGAARVLAQMVAADPRVAEVTCKRVANGHHLQKALVSAMLDNALAMVTGAEDAAAAWQKLLKPTDVVGLKFNSSGARLLNTTHVMATVLVDSLLKAGLPPEQIVLIEVDEPAVGGVATAQPRAGWSSQVHDFGSGRDQLAAVMEQVTALVSIPFLKSHHIARVSGALKNLSHGLIKHPGRYHADGCSPFIGDIVSLPAIRGRLCVSICNAVRCVIDDGPEPTSENVASAGMLLASCDPVALDAVGATRLAEIRAEHGLPVIGYQPLAIPHLAAAARAGLGQADPQRVRVVSSRM